MEDKTKKAKAPLQSRVAYRDWSHKELDAQHDSGAIVPQAGDIIARHVAQTELLNTLSDIRVTQDIRYGDSERQSLDVIVPVGEGPFPCVVFIHGGFWQKNSKAGSGFAAHLFAKRGWASISIGYDLAPEVRVSRIVEQIAAALRHVHSIGPKNQIDMQRIVLSGHSVGAHLAALMLAGQQGDDLAKMFCGAVLISGVFDLEPVAASFINDLARLNTQEVQTLSPVLLQPAVDVPVHLLVGGAELELFHRQSEVLFLQWWRHLTDISLHQVACRNHFDILDELAREDSATHWALKKMLK